MAASVAQFFQGRQLPGTGHDDTWTITVYTIGMWRMVLGLLLGGWLMLHGGLAVAMAYCPHASPTPDCHEPADDGSPGCAGCAGCAYCLSAQAPVLPATDCTVVLAPAIPHDLPADSPDRTTWPTDPPYHPPRTRTCWL